MMQVVSFVIFFSVQLKIQDVHLRFEDGVTNPSQPFAFGICIKNVSMQNAVFEPVSAGCAYKSSSDGCCVLWVLATQ